VTTDRFDTVKTGTGNQVGRSRLWRMRFDDVRNPQAGGTIEMLLNGTEPHQMLDNMTFDSFGQVVMQEDPGGNNYLAKVQVHIPGSGTVTAIAEHDPNRFLPGAPNFLTIDEESSGIIDISDILGRGSYLADIQAHYNVGDPELVEGGQLVVIRATPPNEAPVAQPDTYQTDEDSSLVVPVANGVLSNDTDSDRNAMTAEVVTQPARGTLQLNADGSFIYTPQANFSGEDSFTYRAKDAALAGQPVTVKIVVNALNDAPTATDDVASSYNGVVVEIDVLANDRDVDGDSIAIDDVRNGRHGTAELLANGKIRYTPEADFEGVDEFTYTLRDSKGALSTGRVQVTVVDEIAPTISFTSPKDDAVTSVLNLIAGTVSNRRIRALKWRSTASATANTGRDATTAQR
jgi:VCBS repeat-containing protein